MASNFAAQPERHGLLAEVGQLPARDLMPVDPSGRRPQAGLERRVDGPHRLPVRLQVGHRRNDNPVDRSLLSNAATSADSDGCDVVPDIGALAASTASTPAAAAAQ